MKQIERAILLAREFIIANTNPALKQEFINDDLGFASLFDREEDAWNSPRFFNRGLCFVISHLAYKFCTDNKMHNIFFATSENHSMLYYRGYVYDTTGCYFVGKDVKEFRDYRGDLYRIVGRDYNYSYWATNGNYVGRKILNDFVMRGAITL